MLSIEEISKFYPPELRQFKRNMLREYLQYKVLEILFNLPESDRLYFIGGTALRIVHGSGRFSEDLDFDNFGLTEKMFQDLADRIRKSLEREGYTVSVETKTGGAFRCNIKFKQLLFQQGLSEHADENLLIRLDTSAQGFEHQPEIKTLNKFDVFTQVRVAPPDVLLSQKLYAAFNRARLMGRDFYDVVFLLAITQPNYHYLEEKAGVSTPEELRAYLKENSKGLNFGGLAKDVEPLLIKPEDKKRVELFARYIKDLEL